MNKKIGIIRSARTIRETEILLVENLKLKKKKLINLLMENNNNFLALHDKGYGLRVISVMYRVIFQNFDVKTLVLKR